MKAFLALAAVVISAGILAADISNPPADLILSNVRLYSAPGEPPLQGASIAIRNGRVIEIGSRLTVSSDNVIDGVGRAATGGVWNSHVHFTHPDLKADAVTQLADYHAAGGEILFGTDTGYMGDFDPRDEFELAQRAGMGFDAILASLTTNPANRFGSDTGVLRVGSIADIVVYTGNPAVDIAQFAIREGKLVCRAE